jgi:putative hydrolase
VRLLADLHTHSVASGHAYSTVGELATAAAAKGLELIAVTDHGPTLPGAPHEWHFLNLKIVPSMLSGVRILKGVEANPVPGTPNGLDLPDDTLAKLDFVAVGLHPTVGYDEADEDELTEVILRVIANPLVDMITHPGNLTFPVDVERVVAACIAHGVIVEINNCSYEPSASRSHDTSREIAFARAAAGAGAYVAIDSDAHYHAHVGRCDRAIAVAEEAGISPERVVNRDAASVLAFLQRRRERPRLDMGGVVD